MNAETLPLPLPYAHSPDPWLLSGAGAWQASVSLRAGHVLLGLSPALENASAAVDLADGTISVRDFAASVEGGALSAQLTVASSTPPRVMLDARLIGAALTGPLLETPLDVSGGRLDAQLSLSASGYSPAGLLATLGGSLQATIENGTLQGLDLGAAEAALSALAPGTAPNAGQAASPDAVQTQVAAALGHGATPFSRLHLAATATTGAVTLTQADLQSPAGQLQGAGTLDLLTGQLLAALSIQPALPGAPAVALRLSGPGAAPRRTPDLSALARWLATHQG